MNIINILSVLGLFVASFVGYQRFYMGEAHPFHPYPFFVTHIMLAVFGVSYVLSLLNASGSMSKLFGLLTVALGLLITLVFSVLVLINRGAYPHMFHVPACYIQTVLLLVLVYLWNKKR